VARQELDGARRRRPSELFRWHRWAGVVAAAFLLLLLITGVSLQFAGALGLGHRHVQAEWVLDWYGLDAPADVRISGPAAGVGDRLFLDGQPIASLAGFHGAVTLGDLVVAAGTTDVLVLDTLNGSELDRFHFATPVIRLGRFQQRAALETGGAIHLADAGLVNWTPTAVDPASVEWHTATAADPATSAALQHRYRRQLLSVERLLQDLHSGRALGAAGVVAIDLASLLLGFLAISGLIMWWRTPGR
jgi:hypothetical protein